MKKLVVIFLITSLSYSVMAQREDPKLSQNMFLTPYLNPGAMGQSDKVCAAASLRNQWMGQPDAPTTAVISIHSPFSFLGRNHGVGINIVSDDIAFNSDAAMSLAYSYKANIGNGVLGIGLEAGFINASLNQSWNGAEVITPDSDNTIPKGESAFSFDNGLGIFYSIDGLYAGISTKHLFTSQNFKDNTDASADTRVQLTTYNYAIAGYTIQLPDPMLELMPSIMIRTAGLSQAIFYLNTNIRYNKKFWGGVSYTVGGAITTLAGLELMNGILLGISYDFELSQLRKYNFGSTEITVRYCFDLSLDKTPQKYESIRFL